MGIVVFTLTAFAMLHGMFWWGFRSGRRYADNTAKGITTNDTLPAGEHMKGEG